MASPSQKRILQNFVLIWLDPNINESNDDYCNLLARLRRIVNTIIIFNDIDQCIQFFTHIMNEKIFMIVSGYVGEYVAPQVHDVSQLDSIYVFCGNRLRHKQWTKNWSKVKGVFTDIVPVCELLRKAVRECDHDSVPASFIPSSDVKDQNLEQLDSSFMYSQLLKEILFEIDYNEASVTDFIVYCREQCADQNSVSNFMDNFEREYHLQYPIWWYTYPGFIYSMLNRALRNQEIDTIIALGFFIRDLHRQIEQLYSEQFLSENSNEKQDRVFTVYRGQGMLAADFDKMMKAKGGLISFNNFLSTSEDRDVSLALAESNADNPDLVGILFEINIDTSIKTAPFANVDNVSYFRHQESEVLFSMHTVFRIGESKEIDDNNRLWRVELKLTNDNDQLLKALTERMRHETQGSSGWDRLGQLLLKLAQFDKTEKIYRVLLSQKTSDPVYKAYIYQQLGLVKDNQGDYTKAISFYVEAMQIREKLLPPDHPDLATSFYSLGTVYYHVGEYSKALFFYKKDLEISERTRSPNDSNLASTYNNIGSLHDCMGEYPQALLYYEKALEIKQKTLPSNHPSLSVTYNNIGLIYDNMGEYSKALLSHEKALDIRQKTLPPDHPDLASSYNNIGLVYNNMGEYSKVLPFYEKALEIKQKLLPSNHPSLNTSYNNVGSAYKNMGEHLKALSFYEKALAICQKTLPSNHTDFAYSYNNIGSVYDNMDEYLQALEYYEKALKIRQESLHPNHIDFAYSYNNIGRVYHKMGEYSKAISFWEHALEIFQCSVPSNHPHLKIMQENIASLKKKL